MSEQSEPEPPHRTVHREKEGPDGRTEQPTARSHPYRRPGARPVPRGSRGDRRVRDPWGSDPPRVRPPLRLHESAPHPGPPRAGRRARGGGVRAGDRQGRRLHGDVRARSDQPRHSDRRRVHGLGPVSGHHRAGRARLHRHGRLPGGGHLRNHAADHQAQLPGAIRRRSAAGHRGSVPSGWHRPSRTSAGRPAEGRAARARAVRLATQAGAARVSTGDPPARQAGPGGSAADRRGQAPGPLHRWRRGPRPCDRWAAPVGRAHRHSGRDHADGPWRVSGQPSPASRHAGHARLRNGGDVPAEGRPADRARHPLRRPGHRSARHVRTARGRDPRGHRSGRDRQEPHGRRADRGRRA